MAKTVSVTHKQRRNTYSGWVASNPVLADGQIGVVTDATPRRLKIGDGTTVWSSLPFADMGISVGTSTTLANLPIDKTAMIVTISAAQGTFSYLATPPSGFQQTILLKNSTGSVITQAIPNTNGWVAIDNTSIDIPANGSVELSVMYIDSTYRVVSKK
ncbi:MAG: hypothetical protein AB9922_12410 [Bacteroidales bacterium]